MIPPAPVVRFACTALVLFVALLVPRAAYPPLYRATASTLYSHLGGARIATFEEFPDDPEGKSDTLMGIGSEGAGIMAKMGVDSVRQGWVPTALLAALALATPVSWRRRLTALGLGALALQVFVMLSTAVALARGFSVLPGGEQLALGNTAKWLVFRLDKLLSGDITTSYLAGVLTWAALLLRRRDFHEGWGLEPRDDDTDVVSP